MLADITSNLIKQGRYEDDVLRKNLDVFLKNGRINKKEYDDLIKQLDERL